MLNPRRRFTMATFGIETEKNINVIKFMEATHRRINSNNFLKSPFNGSVERISTTFKAFYVVDIKPIYPNIPLFAGVIMAMICLVFFKWPFIVASLIFFTLSLIWTRYFFQFMLKIGLKKAGYKENINFLSPGETLKRVLNNGTK